MLPDLGLADPWVEAEKHLELINHLKSAVGFACVSVSLYGHVTPPSPPHPLPGFWMESRADLKSCSPVLYLPHMVNTTGTPVSHTVPKTCIIRSIGYNICNICNNGRYVICNDGEYQIHPEPSDKAIRLRIATVYLHSLLCYILFLHGTSIFLALCIHGWMPNCISFTLSTYNSIHFNPAFILSASS